MTIDFRALCVELVDELDYQTSSHEADELIDRARALLAEPVVAWEPMPLPGDAEGLAEVFWAEPEDEGPSDEELEAIELALWDKYRTKGWGGEEFMYDNNFSYALEEYRAVLARWGRPAAAPVPEPGEVAELVAELGSKDRWTQLTDAQLDRAATLLQQQAAPAPVVAPVPVSERLPGPEDCDAEDNCWWFDPHADGAWYLDTYQSCYTHWLPAHALPTPEATND